MSDQQRMPNLMLPEFREMDYLENEYDMEIFVEPTLETTYIRCPHCGSSIVSVHANDERFFRDINMYEKRVGVAVNGKRYKCGDCKKTFVLQYQCIEPDGKLSKRLKEAIQKKALSRTFTGVAEEYGLAEKTVERVFGEYTEILNLRPDVKAPRVLGIDECHLQKQMRPVYVDIENATILEMGRSVKKIDVVRDLAQFADLDKVEIVTTDMCAGYRSAIWETMPKAIHIVDKFHVVQMFIRTVDEARKGIYEKLLADIEQMPSAERDQKKQQLIDLGIDAYMFRMSPENMADWRLLRHNEIIETYPEFRVLATLRKMFFNIYKAPDEKSARSAYAIWRSAVPKYGPYKEMSKFARTTFRNWDREIFNYFKVDGRKTNATTERLNGAIKSMQNMGRGYSYPVLRAKMLFGTKTAKWPKYRRISQSAAQLYESEPNKMSLAFLGRYGQEDGTKSFSLDPCIAGGTLVPAAYYGGKETSIFIDDPRVLEYSGGSIEAHCIEGEIPRRAGLKLVKNGGASIEKVIEYGQKHGECI